jgi:hypothetical protein
VEAIIMIRMTTVLSLFLAAAGMSWSEASAQPTKVYSDIGCDQSQLVVPAGLRCRATQEFGSSAITSSKGNGSLYRNYTASGKAGDATVYYMLYDSIGPSSNQHPDGSLKNLVLDLSPEAKHAKDFSELSSVGGGDYLTFTSSKGDSCLGVRKLGPTQGRGYKWVVYATRCVPPGKTPTQSEAQSFLAGIGYKG